MKSAQENKNGTSKLNLGNTQSKKEKPLHLDINDT